MPVSLSAQSGSYNFVNIDYPDAYLTIPEAVNDHGAIVGYYLDTQYGNYHGFLYSGGTYTTIDDPAGTTFPEGINNAGVITGAVAVSATETHGFIYSNGVFTSFDYPGTNGVTSGRGINNSNEIAGIYSPGGISGFLDNNGAFSPINYPGSAIETSPHSINDSGQVAGYYTDSTVPFGFVYNGSTFTSINYTSGYATFVYGINNAGVVVGYSSLNGYPIYEVGFLWQAGQFTIINSDAFPQPYGINNNGQIVGDYFPSNELHGFLATPISGPPLQLVTVTPCRLVDTRQTGGPIQGGSSRSFTVPALGGCHIPSTAGAYSLNVTVVPPGPLSYLTIWPTGQSQPTTSLLNSTDGRTKANAAIVPAGTSGAVSVYVSNTTNVILDIDGYFEPPASGTYQFYPLTPCRLVDTRGADGELGGPRLVAQTARSFPLLMSSCIPAGLHPNAYSLNFTVIPSPSGQPLGYLTVWPTGETQPGVSTLNNPTATVVANAAIVPAGTSGAIDVYPSNTTDLLIDIDGYFAPAGTGGLSMYPAAPCRVLDTRQSGGSFVGEKNVNVVGSACAPPSSAAAYIFNATVVPPGSMPYLTLWPNGEPQPTVSTLNAPDGFITSNMAIVPTTNGSIDAYAKSLTQLLLDISGYFAP
jgi:probable HAF family extracellular repeat protein